MAEPEHRLYTERLCLRPPTPDDAEGLYELFADAEVMDGLGRECASGVEDVRAIIEGMLRDWSTEGVGAFVLETAAPDRQVVGQAGVMIFDRRDWTPSTWARAGSHAQPELGWALTRAFWGHGYATEGAAAIRDWALKRADVERLVSLISPDNVRSQRVAGRLGAVPTETVTPADSNRTAVVWRHSQAEVPGSRYEVPGTDLSREMSAGGSGCAKRGTAWTVPGEQQCCCDACENRD